MGFPLWTWAHRRASGPLPRDCAVREDRVWFRGPPWLAHFRQGLNRVQAANLLIDFLLRRIVIAELVHAAKEKCQRVSQSGGFFPFLELALLNFVGELGENRVGHRLILDGKTESSELDLSLETSAARTLLANFAREQLDGVLNPSGPRCLLSQFKHVRIGATVAARCGRTWGCGSRHMNLRFRLRGRRENILCDPGLRLTVRGRRVI